MNKTLFLIKDLRHDIHYMYNRIGGAFHLFALYHTIDLMEQNLKVEP